MHCNIYDSHESHFVFTKSVDGELRWLHVAIPARGDHDEIRSVVKRLGHLSSPNDAPGTQTFPTHQSPSSSISGTIICQLN